MTLNADLDEWCWPGDCREEPGNADHPQCRYCAELDGELPCPADVFADEE